MWEFLKKFISAFSYGSGFMLAVFCAFFAVNQYSNRSVQTTSNISASLQSNKSDLEKIEIKHISKLSNFVNYTGEGRKEQFIFTGELKNNSNEESYEMLTVEIDLYDSENKFIFKCGGWDGSGITLMLQATTTFQKICHSMPAEIATRYHSHKAVIKQRKL